MKNLITALAALLVVACTPSPDTNDEGTGGGGNPREHNQPAPKHK